LSLLNVVKHLWCWRRPAVLVCLGLMPPLAMAGAGDGYIASLQHRAAAQRLAASPEWQALLHYEPNWMRGGVHSEVASPWFFVSAVGKTDPQAELDATIAALFSADKIGPRKKPAFCLFVARRKFLVSHLHIDVSRLPVQVCPEYQRWLAALAPDAVSLVFPTAFPNSPSSMFGHTLLRVDSARRRHGTELLSYAVNFAAAAGDDGRGLGFVWKGLTGGYPGVFGLFPYYKKVKQYAWIENRDVWSYPLALSRPQIARLIDHIWEMDSVRFVYYFFNKNCSYQLLSLLDVARPSLHLTRQYTWYAIPSDTIRSLAAVPGLLGPAEYRPSMQTSLHWEASQLTHAQLSLAQAVANRRLPLNAPRLAALDGADHAGVLEVAYDELRYRLQAKGAQAGDVDEDLDNNGDPVAATPADTATERFANRILLARSRIPRRSPFSPVPAPRTSPEDGHRSLRINASGIYADGNFSLGVRIRPAYHDLLDNPGGYTRGAEINLADLGLRLDPSDGRVRIEDFRLLDIVSLSPRDSLFKPISFQVDTGVRRRPSARVFGDAPNDLGYYLQAGPGLAWGHDKLTAYVFGLGSFDANPSLQPAYAVGAGGSAGLLAYPLPGIQIKSEVGALQYVAGADGYFRWAKLGAQFPLIDEFALRTSVEYDQTAVDDGVRVDFGIQAYF
jgi:hypothetical protein